MFDRIACASMRVSPVPFVDIPALRSLQVLLKDLVPGRTGIDISLNAPVLGAALDSHDQNEPPASSSTCYLSRYTHRVAISNARLIAHDGRGVTFHYKDCRADGLARRKVMTLAPEEFIRRFLIHVLPKGFHRIRHYGLFANSARAANIARMRELLGQGRAPALKATRLAPAVAGG